MPTLSEQILEAKTAAKNLRDRGLKGYRRAVNRLQEAIAKAQEGLEETNVPDLRRNYARHLADCFGMIGGVERRWGLEGEADERSSHLVASCQAYDAGCGFEWDEQYDIRASYNLVNRLTGRLLLCPDLLREERKTDPGFGLAPINFPEEMQQAIGKIVDYLANKGDFWAEADLALLRMLTRGEEPESAYAIFLSLSPPRYAFESALDGLRPLAALPLSSSRKLQAAVALLKARYLSLPG
jgi:hypothetical protein